MKKNFILLFFLVIWQSIFAQSDSTKSLLNETMLHPADAFTGYVYSKGEWGYNQALTPYPSWAWWGITNRLTAEIDIEALLGGVPSFNFRFGISKNDKWKPAIAVETMYQYINKERDQFHNLDYLEINRKGSSWYNHMNFSWKIGNNIHFHIMGGMTYADNISISNGDSIAAIGSSFKKQIHPDYSFGLDWRINRWVSLHSTYSYGSTFLYADNIPRKQQYVFATRMAPFIKSKKGFFNSFRFELAYLYANFADAREHISGPIGFVYWQWHWNKKR